MGIFTTTQCRSCLAPIVWAETDKGRPMPVDAERVPNGNVVLREPADPRDPPTAHYAKAGMGTHVSHFATCPDAAAHRKAKK